MFRALLYAYVLGGLTFIPLLIFAAIFITIYTSVPVGDPDVTKRSKSRLESKGTEDQEAEKESQVEVNSLATSTDATNDIPRTRKGWLTVRRTFEEAAGDGSYVTLVRSFLDSRSKDPKKSRPKDMWYVVLKGKVLYLYEDEEMSDCEAAIELGSHQVVIYPEDLPDAELFAKRNAICLKPKGAKVDKMPSVTKKMKLKQNKPDEQSDSSSKSRRRDSLKELVSEEESSSEAAREQAFDPNAPWFIFVRSNVEMEDWYFSLVHASEQPAQTPTLQPLTSIFDPSDMYHLVSTLDEQPDVIPMRWLNAILGRIFFSHYRTQNLESYIIGRLMKKLSKVKRPAFLTEIEVTEVAVGNKAPMFSKPMLKELTKEGDASIEVHLQYKGEIRITVEATAVINLGARFKSYTVKLTLAAVLKELEGNLLIKIKRPPSNRLWYAFTTTPRIVLEVEPIVSDRQLTWGMILSTIESKFKEIIQESVVLPNMDDIAYFDTERYKHRGGIWSDTGRRPREPKLSTNVQEDAQSTQSAPALTTLSTDASATSVTEQDDDASTQSAPVAPATQVEDTPPISGLPDDSSDSGRSGRRRTWFSSVRNDDLVTASAPSFFPEPEVEVDRVDEVRGRLNESDNSLTPRSQSTSPESGHSVSTGPAEKPLQHVDLPSDIGHSTRRSVSQHSVKAMQSDESDSSLSRPKSSPSTPRKNSGNMQTGRPPSPQSFFSTLKSKATDKQAISNTAKEAMKKWGVNWGGFKKDGNQTPQTDESTSGSPPRQDPSQRNETAASNDVNKSSLHKFRGSFAEVQAAVAERRGREHRNSALFPGSRDAPESPGLTPSAPETFMSANGASTIPETHGNESSTAPFMAPPANHSRMASKKSFPSLGVVNVAGKDSTTQPPQPQELPSTEQPVKPTPIHIQPVAKTMSIPGIHASHRGEIQSMGYVAPQSPPSAAQPNGPVTEAMLKIPDFQKVYRFLKPSNSQMPSSAPFEPSPGSVELSVAEGEMAEPQTSNNLPSNKDSQSSDDLAGGAAVTPTAPNPVLPSLVSPKPTPPPLPPRSIPVPVSRSEKRDVPSAISGSPSSSASEALKTIVKRDQRKRSLTGPLSENASLPSESPSVPNEQGEDNMSESNLSVVHGPTHEAALTPSDRPIVNGNPPPLPPRRIQTPSQ